MNREHDTTERAPGLPARRVFGTPAAVVESAPGGAEDACLPPGRHGRATAEMPEKLKTCKRLSLRRGLTLIFRLIFLNAITLLSGCATLGADPPVDQGVQAPSEPPIQPAQATPEQLQQLVAPIALYPDELVAQILAASTYPTQIVEAERWLQQHSSLKGAQLADEVDKEPWDPSVKALTQSPSVLANLDKNLSWTSALGDAYFNDQQDVLNAVQVMRKRAQVAGTLKTTPQQNVGTQGQTIVIEPANPEIVYLPEYDPWIVYGAPLAVYPGYFAGPWIGAPIVSFGIGFPIGWPYGWGWDAWGCNWLSGVVIFNHNTFISRSHTFIHHRDGFRFGGGFRGHENDFRDRAEGSRGGPVDHRARDGFRFGGGFRGHENDFRGRAEGNRGGPVDHRADRGFVVPHLEPGRSPGAFSGFDHGGVANQHSFRGQSSFGGGMRGGSGEVCAVASGAGCMVASEAGCMAAEAATGNRFAGATEF